MNRPRTSTCVAPLILLGVGLLGVSVMGCSSQHRPVFEPQADAPVWPPAPQPARIKYVGALKTAADLKAPRPLFAALGDLLAGEAPPQPLYGPRSCTVTDDGRFVWVGDPGGRCLHLFDLLDRVYTKVTHAGEQRLLSPVGLCLGPEGTVFVSDSENAAVYRYAAETGAFLEALRLPEEIRRPAGIAYDLPNDRLFVVDVSAHNLKVLDSHAALQWVLGQRGNAPGQFNFPCEVALDGNNLWVADAGNQRVQLLTPEGEALAAVGQLGDAPGDLALPKAITLDRDGHLYVVDARFENIQVFDRRGQLLLVFGGEGSAPGEFWLPGGLFFDRQDRLWVCDTYNARVQVFEYVPDEVTDGETAPATEQEDRE